MNKHECFEQIHFKQLNVAPAVEFHPSCLQTDSPFKMLLSDAIRVFLIIRLFINYHGEFNLPWCCCSLRA